MSKNNNALSGKRHSTLLSSATHQRLEIAAAIGGRKARRSAERQLRALEKAGKGRK